MFRTLFVFTAAAAVLAAGPVVADVYKFKDEKGNVLYTDKPSTLPAERLNVQSQKTDVVAVQNRQQEELKRQQAADKSQQQGSTPGTDQQPAAQAAPKDSAERCAKARERYDGYMKSQRLYEVLPDGQRRYLSDAELETTRAAAKASMEALCQ
jgi:hypothetical protein